MGKSSTANSLFRERVAKPSVFQEGDSKPAAVSRKAADFVLTVIDTPSLQDAESVSQPVCAWKDLWNIVEFGLSPNANKVSNRAAKEENRNGSF